MALRQRQLPVVKRSAGHLPRFAEGFETGDLERAGRSGCRELMRRGNHFAYRASPLAAVAAAQGDFGDGELAIGRFAAGFQIDGSGEASVVSDGLGHQ